MPGKPHILGKIERYEAIMTGFAIATAGLMLVCGTFAWLLYRNATTEKTILVPAYMSGPASITGATLSREYLTDITYLVRDLAWEFTPEGARAQFSVLLRHYMRESVTKAREELYRYADDIEKYGWESSFEIQQMKIDPVKNTILLKGNRKIWGKGNLLEGYPKVEKWEIKYGAEGGSLFKIRSILPKEKEL